MRHNQMYVSPVSKHWLTRFYWLDERAQHDAEEKEDSDTTKEERREKNQNQNALQSKSDPVFHERMLPNAE